MQIQLYDILEKANDRHSKRISGCRGQGGGATPRFLWTKARWDPQADPERIIPRGSFWESGKTHTLPPWEVKQHKGPGKASFQGSSEEGKAQQPELPLHWHTWHRARVHRPGESTGTPGTGHGSIAQARAPQVRACVCSHLCVDRSAHTQAGGSIWVCLRLYLHLEFTSALPLGMLSLSLVPTKHRCPCA